eukprot:3716183-Lingulodinium_polyedra.AAC.1
MSISELAVAEEQDDSEELQQAGAAERAKAGPLRMLIKRCMAQTDAVLKVGKAPPGAMERELSEYLRSME